MSELSEDVQKKSRCLSIDVDPAIHVYYIIAMFIPGDAKEILTEIIESAKKVEEIFQEERDYIDSKSPMSKLEQTEHYGMSLLRDEAKKLELQLGLLEYSWCHVNPEEFESTLERDGDEFYFRYWRKGTSRSESCDSIQIPSYIYWTLVDRSPDTNLSEFRITCRAIHEDFSRVLLERTIAAKSVERLPLDPEFRSEFTRGWFLNSEDTYVPLNAQEILEDLQYLIVEVIRERTDEEVEAQDSDPLDFSGKEDFDLSDAVEDLPYRWCGFDPILYNCYLVKFKYRYYLVFGKVGGSTWNTHPESQTDSFEWWRPAHYLPIEAELYQIPEHLGLILCAHYNLKDPITGKNQVDFYLESVDWLLRPVRVRDDVANQANPDQIRDKADITKSRLTVKASASSKPTVSTQDNNEKEQCELPTLVIRTGKQQVCINGQTHYLQSPIYDKVKALTLLLNMQKQEPSIDVDGVPIALILDAANASKSKTSVHDLFKDTKIWPLLKKVKRGYWRLNVNLEKSRIL